MSLLERNIGKSITIAYSLFSPVKTQSNYHFSFGFDGSKLISIGQNDPTKPSIKAMKIAKFFAVNHFLEFPFLHSEIDVISKLWGKRYVNKDLVLINIRLNKAGKLMKSKPCKNCQLVLDALNIEKVYWSNNTNGFSISYSFDEEEVIRYENNI